MFTPKESLSGFSVDNLDSGRAFHGELLGLPVAEGETGTLRIAWFMDPAGNVLSGTKS